MKVLLLGVLAGALVVFDPLLTTYLLRDFSWLRDLPYMLSIMAALAIGGALAAQRLAGRLAVTIIHDYWRYFPLLFLLSYQFTGVAAGPLDPTDIIVGVFIVLLLTGLLTRQDHRFVATPFNMLHLAFMICVTISLVATFKFTGYVRSLKPFILFFLLVSCLPRENVIPTFVRWLIVLAGLSAIFGLIQQAVFLSSGILLSLVEDAQMGLMVEAHFGVPMFRLPAMMTGYRPFALFTAAATILAVSALLYRKDGELMRPRWLILCLCAIVPAMLMTFAKDIILGLTAALLLLFFMYRPKRFAVVGAVAGLAGALALTTVIAIVPGNIDTAIDLTRTVPKAEIERIRLDRDSIEGFVHGPFFWTGRGVFAGARYTAHSRRWAAHNAFILAAAELGIVGVTILVLIYGLAVARAVALNIVVNNGPYLPIVRSLLPILVIIFVGAQFEADYLEMFIWTMFATIEALWFLVRRQAAAKNNEPRPGGDTSSPVPLPG